MLSLNFSNPCKFIEKKLIKSVGLLDPGIQNLKVLTSESEESVGKQNSQVTFLGSIYLRRFLILVMRKQNKTPKLPSWGLYIYVDFNFSNEKTKQNTQVTFLGCIHTVPIFNQSV